MSFKVTNPTEKPYIQPSPVENLQPADKKEMAVDQKAQQVFEELGKDYQSSRLLDGLKRVWKVITGFFSEILHRISNLFVTSKSKPQTDLKTHEIVFHQHGIHSTPVLSKTTSESQSTTSSESAEEGDMALSEADLSMEEGVEAERGESILDHLFRSIVDMQQASRTFKLERYSDIDKAREFLDELGRMNQLLLDVKGTMNGLSVEKEQLEEVGLLSEMLKATGREIGDNLFKHRYELLHCMHITENADFQLSCADLLWRSVLMKSGDFEDAVSSKPKRPDPVLAILRPKEPVGLINGVSIAANEYIGRNACYRNAVNQVLRIPVFQDIAATPHQGERGAEVKEALSDLWNYQQVDQPEALKLLRYDEHLLSQIYKSELMPELLPNERYRQQDAALYLEMLLKDVFNYNFPTERVRIGMHDGKEVKRVQELNEPPLFHIQPMSTLEKGIEGYLRETVNDSENAWKPVVNGKSVTINESQIHFRIATDEPVDVMVVNVKRRNYDLDTGNYEMDTTPMAIPEDGVVDFYQAYGLSANSALYQLQRFVWFQDAGKKKGDSAGHYIAYVNENGSWYECNDSVVTKIDAAVDRAKFKEFQQRKEQLSLGVFVLLKSA